MTIEQYIDEIKLEITGNTTHLEISDEVISKILSKSLREVNRYIDATKLITIPFAPCIDLGPYTDSEGKYHEGFKHSAVVNVFRTEGYTGDTTSGGVMYADPMQAQMWMAFTNGGTMYNLQDYVMNYLAYNTLLQMRNTTSTDLSFREDKSENKLYINTCYNAPNMITIEYIPLYESVEEINDPYWTDILLRLAIATTKVILGRIRSKYKLSGQVELDGETLLAEGNDELKELRERLRINDQLSYGVD